MKTAGVRELKARLSSYLREVQRGEGILVTDRGRVVAEIRAPDAAARASDATSLRYEQLVERGSIRPAPDAEQRAWRSFKGLGMARGSARAILDADREG